MNNFRRSKMLIDAAEESLAQAMFSFNRQAWNLTIRRCQEAVELGLSGILALMGVHYPKDHDQAPLLIQVLNEKQISFMTISTIELQKISIDLSLFDYLLNGLSLTLLLTI